MDKELEAKADETADRLLEALEGFKPGNLADDGETDMAEKARRAKITDARTAAGITDMSGLDKAAMLTNIHKLAGLPVNKQIGACGELAAYAYVNFAMNSDTFGSVYMFEAPNTKSRDDYHAFVVLGLKKAAGEMDLTKNDDAIIVDLWMSFAVDGWGAVVSGEDHAKALKNCSYDLKKSRVLYPPAV